MQIDWKNRQQVLVVVAIGIVVLFVANLVILTPLTNAWKARSERIMKLRKDVAAGGQLLQRGQALRSRWGQMRRTALTNDTSAAELRMFNAIDQWAQDARATITARTPQWKHDADEYMTYECRVDVAGTLDALSRFLYNLEKDKESLAVKLESLELSTRDKQGQQLTLGVQLSGLLLNPPTK